MPKNTSRWSPEEQMELKRLREQQIQKGYIDWKQIATYLNQKYHSCFRTPKQCREKYINFYKFQENNTSKNEWTQKQMESLKKYYLLYGPSWVFLSTEFNRYDVFLSRSQNSIKNFFNNLLRKAAKTLSCYEIKVFSRQKSALITTQNLMGIMDFINKLRKSLTEQKYTLNYQCSLFKNWLKILDYVFLVRTVLDQQTEQITKCVKNINKRLGSFKMFKDRSKIKKNWKLTKNNIQSFIQLDQVIVRQDLKIEQKSDIQVKNEENPLFLNQQVAMNMNIAMNNSLLSMMIFGYAPQIQVKQQVKKQEEQNLCLRHFLDHHMIQKSS